MSVSKDNKNNDIQVFRAIAIILVVIQHYRWRLPSPEWYLNTFNYVSYWAGVDIFLAISGFLMFKIISKEIKTNGRTFYSFFHFISKRIFRLYPALIFWVIMSVITAWYIQPDFNANAKLALSNAIPSLFSYSNLFWYNCSVNELNCGSSDLSGITWSLSLEWQLYLIPSIFQ